jgi:hypothetical protein
MVSAFYGVLVRAKIMVNENHFQFDRKIFFNFWKILKIVNRFLKLNSSSLHTRLISDCRNPAMVGRRNPSGTEIRQHLVTGILLTPESGNGRSSESKRHRNPATSGRRNTAGDIQPPSPDAGGPDSSRI